MDTTRTRAWTRRERMDNEFWLLKGLSEMLLKANFKEISVETIKRSLLIHTASEGVRVEVDATNYDIIKFWALGKEKTESNTLLDRFLSICGVNPANEQYKRIVVASRLRKDDKLSIKAFKDVGLRIHFSLALIEYFSRFLVIRWNSYYLMPKYECLGMITQ